MMTSLVQILVGIAVFTGGVELARMSDEEIMEKYHNSTVLITYILYIVLFVMDLFVIIFAWLMLYGNERTDEIKGRKFMIPWIIITPIYVIYESGINIFYFYNQFNKVYTEIPIKDGYPLGFILVPLVYWVVKEILLFICFVFILIRIQSLLAPVVQYVEPEMDCFEGPMMVAPEPMPPSIPECSCYGGGINMYSSGCKGCRGCSSSKSFDQPPVTSCSGGACSSGCSDNRCKKCKRPKPQGRR
jgi:hypothetical protein